MAPANSVAASAHTRFLAVACGAARHQISEASLTEYSVDVAKTTYALDPLRG